MEDRAKCFKGLESTIPLRPQQELEELRLKKENSRKQQTWNQSPKGMTKHRQSQKPRKTKGSKARTPSQNLWGQTPKQLVNSQEPSFRKATTGRNGTRVLHRLGACFMVPGIGYPRYVHLGALMPRQSDFDSICKLCARNGTEVAQGDSDARRRHPLVKQASEPRTASEPRDFRTTVSVTLRIPKIANIQSPCPDDTPRCESTVSSAGPVVQSAPRFRLAVGWCRFGHTIVEPSSQKNSGSCYKRIPRVSNQLHLRDGSTPLVGPGRAESTSRPHSAHTAHSSVRHKTIQCKR